MAKIGLFYATESGTTKKVAQMIRKQFGESEVDIYNVTKAKADDLRKYSAIIFGTPTLGMGELPETLDAFLPTLEEVEFAGKTVALFGLGNQEDYPDEFVDALGILYKKLKKRGARFIGTWPTDSYEFSQSKAVINGEFIGLVIDHDNQEDLTPERIAEWVEQVKSELLGVALAA